MSKKIVLARSLNLSPIESEVFEYLLEYHNSRAAHVRKVLHLNRTAFYRSLTSLEDKGIISITGKLREQVIAIRDIEEIKVILDKKKEDITLAKNSLNAIQSQMKSLRDARYQKDNIKIFSGPNAFMKAMDETLNGGGKIFRDLTPDSAAVYELAGGENAYLDFIHDFKKRRVAKKIQIRILLDNKAKTLDELDYTNILDLKEVRQFGGNLKLDCFLNTCGDHALFYTKDQDGSWGLVIKDGLITKLLNTLFDYIWSQSLKVEESKV